VARNEALEAGLFRGEGRFSGGGTVNVQGETFRALPGDATLMGVFEEGVQDIERIQHPLARAVTYAAFAAYHQFYFDGNKRTGRFVMNTILMSHGFDAIMTPARLREEYNRSLAQMYLTDNLTPHMRFLVCVYDDGAPPAA